MAEKVKRRGLMLVLSSPSGAGKTTLARALLAEDSDTVLSVSTTTRPKRPGEEDGKDYDFVNAEAFQAQVDADDFLEFATVFEHAYGTPRTRVDTALAEGQDVLFDIDWQGTQQLAQKARDDLVSIFILPPSVSSLRDRLKSRGQDSEEQIEKRMQTAQSELSHWAEYTYVLINENFDDTLAGIKRILNVERNKRFRQESLVDFVKELTEEAD